MGLLDGALGEALGSMMGGANTAAGAGNLQGMLGGLLGQLGGAQGGNSQVLLTTVMTLVQQHGGLEGIVERFRANGLGGAVDSWVGTGANTPVSADSVTQVFGTSTITEIASKLGVDPQQASGSLASVLPEIVNHLTPNGQIPANSGDLLSQGLAMLTSRLGG